MRSAPKSKIYLFILLLISVTVFAKDFKTSGEVSEKIKTLLQADLKDHYLKKLEAKLGYCGASPESCLSTKDDFLKATLPKGEVCFPYTLCGFYNCMEEHFRCNEVGINYFTELAFLTCSAYEKNIQQDQFSPEAIEWIYSVMVCLQKGLIDECVINGNCPTSDKDEVRKKTCDHITDFTLAYHPGCYINSGIGVCHLPLKDKLAIWNTVNPFMTAREKREAYKVIFSCLKP